MKLTLGKKLALGFGVVLSLTVLSSVLGFLNANRIRQSEDIAFEVRIPSLKAAVRLQRDLNQTQVKGRQAILAGSQPRRLAEARNLFEGTWRDVEQDMARMDELAPHWSDEANRDRLEEIKKQLLLLHNVQQDAIGHAAMRRKNALSRAGNESADRATPINIAMKKSLGSMADSFDKLVDDNEHELWADNRSLDFTMAVTTLAELVIGICVAMLLSRRIAGATRSILSSAEAVAEGNLTGDDLETGSPDELGDLAKAANKMNGNLKRMILAISDNTAQIASASEELSSSAALQAQGAGSQTSQAAQVAGAMQEMSSTVQLVSESCSRAAEASRRASETAREGGIVVDETLTKMQSIADSVGAVASKISKLGQSSMQIGRIASVIDGIADQTNMLALNAAIEAARAGEHGRGFAVVADEVHKLAERTASATKEIAGMIATIQAGTAEAVKTMENGRQLVEEGVAFTGRAGESLQQIIQMSEEVGSMITQIAASATEQTTTTAEINRSMDQIAQLVKESAVGAQQSAKVCQDLSELALAQYNLVSVFKLPSRKVVSGDSYFEEAQQEIFEMPVLQNS